MGKKNKDCSGKRGNESERNVPELGKVRRKERERRNMEDRLK